MPPIVAPVAPLAPWTLAGRTLEWGQRTYVMGILNVTPDSFSDGGRHGTVESALRHARRMVAEGADLIDVGGESTRPGSESVPAGEEARRVLPVITAISRELDVLVSIDTSKPEVARAAIAAGAHLVNDVTGLRSPDMLAAVAELGIPAVAMHMRGTPRSMQQDPRYEDVAREVGEELSAARDRARAAGVERVMLDPGIGFGKTLEHNLALLRSLASLRALGSPVLLGTSRKGFLGQLLDLPVEERLEGTLATLALGVAQGVDMVRVHDVAAAVRTVRVADAIARGREAARRG